jgi:hypothetical protein
MKKNAKVAPLSRLGPREREKVAPRTKGQRPKSKQGSAARKLVAKLAHVVTGPDGVPARHQTGMRGILSISPG